MKRNEGFTLIELISVIIILGILASTAGGLFATKENFEASVLKNQLLSSFRLSQQLALSRQNLSTSVPVSLIIAQTSDEWTFTIWDSNPAGVGNTAFDTSSVERSSATLRFSTSDFATACSGLSSSTSYTVSFDGDGNLLSGGQLRVCAVGEQTYQLCVSSLGFAYEGNTCL